MIKRHAYITFIFTLLIQIYCQQQQIEEKKEIPKPKEFSINSIQKRKFINTGIIHRLELEFHPDGKYEFTYASEGIYWYNAGKYEISKEKILLYANICKEYKDDKIPKNCKTTFGNGYCQLEKPKFNFFYYKILTCDSNANKRPFNEFYDDANYLEFEISEFKIPKEEKIEIEGIQSIAIGELQGVTTSDVKYRAKPNITSKRYFYKEFYDSPDLPFIPKNTEIIVHARTLEKDKVKSWENYWYYISVRKNNLSGWAFAEFVQIKND